MAMRNCRNRLHEISFENYFCAIARTCCGSVFLAVSIDALAKQLSILEVDCTTLETLQQLGFLRMIALKTLQKLGVLRMIALKTLQKLGFLRMIALKTLQKLGVLRKIALKTLQKQAFLKKT